MYFFRPIYSAVIILPALFSGYFKNWLISDLVSGPAVRITRFTTVAGSSSSMSTASSTNRSSMILASSASVMLLIMCSCTSGSRNANTSAASSLGSIRNTMTFGLSSSSPRNSAISASFISERRARSSRNFRSCIYCINSSASYCSIDPILSFGKERAEHEFRLFYSSFYLYYQALSTYQKDQTILIGSRLVLSIIFC